MEQREDKGKTEQLPAVKAGYYRHFKGDIYRVWATATHSETTEPMVVYERVRDGSLWVRPHKMWHEIVCRGSYEGPRFVYLEKEREK